MSLTRRIDRDARAASARFSLGTAQLGTGLVVAGGLIVATCFLQFAVRADEYPNTGVSLAAWVLLLFVIVVTALVVRHNGFIMGDVAFSALVAGLAAVVALDLIGVWGHTGPRLYPTAAVAVSGVLLAVVTLRRVHEIMASTIVLGAVLSTALVAGMEGLTASTAVEILMLTTAIGPPIVACVIVASYRRMVMMAMDRVLIQSTVSAPAFGTSMLESEELQALDLEVEEFFDDVASGREPLPLSDERATRAAELATALRMTLVAGRNRTWLHHAITESDFLAASVTLRDPDATAALLDQDQRDALLSALWLIMAGDSRGGRAAIVTFGRTSPDASDPRHDLRFTVTIDVDGLRRVDVDPATWDNLGRLGSYVDTATARALRVEIECRVMNPGEL